MRMNVEPTNHLSSVLCPLSSDAGFTLIELILVIVILGIVGVMGADFISQAFRGFADTEARTEIYEEGKIALVRMEREIRNAVPNAINVSDSTGLNDSDTISFGVIDETVMNNNGVFGQYTELNPTNSITDQSAGLPVNTLISIYNTSWADFSTGGRIYSVTNNNTNPMTLNPAIAISSPNQRFHAVGNNAISYSVDASGTLNRLTAPVGIGGVGAFGNAQPLAQNISQTGALPFFAYSAGALSQNGLVVINFSITRRGTTVSFHKEVHIRNVP